MIDSVLANRYRIQAKVGEGGMAVVYRAMDVVLRRVVAIKVLRSQYASDPEFVDRFRREAQAAASLSHPNVVNIFDVGQDDDVHYIVLEYVQGHNLKQIVRQKGPLSPRRAAQIARSVARALEAAHARGLVHRDIKPHNILITQEGRVKVADFGLARAASAATLTETGTVIGSVHYFSPEQARGQAVGPASDIYSLGVVLYEMLTGDVPFRGDSPIAVALKHLQEDPPPPGRRNDGIPAWLEQVVLRSLAKNPGERYASAAVMADALEWKNEARPLPAPKPVVASEAEPRGFDGARSPARQADVKKAVPPDLHDALRRELLGRPSSGSPAPPDAENDEAVAAAADESREGRRGGRGRAWLTALAVTVVLAGVLYAAWPRVLALVFPPEVTVPDVVGLTYDEAKPVMEAAGLVLEIEAEQFHPEIPAGRIVRQTPPAERIVRQGRHILIALSRGPEIGLVPDIVGMPLREARIAVTQAGYTLGQEFDDFSDEAVANFVTSQQPPPGAEVAKGTPIDLWVGRRAAAAAEETVTIPDFRGRDIDQVVQELERLGLMPGNRWPELSPFVPAGIVLDQNPEPDAVVPPGTAVDFVYSQGLPGLAPEAPADAGTDDVGAQEPPAVVESDWESLLSDEAETRRRRARVDIEVPAGRGQEVVILIIDDFGAREVYRQTVAGGTTLHEFVEGRGDQARLQVYVGGVMYMDQPFPD